MRLVRYGVGLSLLERGGMKGDTPVYLNLWSMSYRVELFGNAALTGGKFHLRLNIIRRPIVHKYREGKMQRTLKRELKST